MPFNTIPNPFSKSLAAIFALGITSAEKGYRTAAQKKLDAFHAAAKQNFETECANACKP